MAEICTAAGLYFVSDAHDFVWDNLVQTGESDWQFMVHLAETLGYHLVTRSTGIRLVDPYKAIRSAPVATRFTMHPQVILTFRPVLSANSQDYGEYTIDTLDDRGQYVQMTSAAFPASGLGRVQVPTTKVKRITRPVGSTTEARIMLEATQRSHWPLRARLRAQGLTRVHPGVVVSIEGVEPEYAGLWYVLEATHDLTTAIHTVDCQVVRDAVIGAGRSPAPHEPAYEFPNVRVDPGTGRWRSQWGAA